MQNLLVLGWWFLISTYSLYNIKKLYYIKYNKNNIIDVHVFKSSCIFILACCIRSIFPRIDGRRICIINTWLSYTLVGRICATFGELAFVYQLTLTTKSIARRLNCYQIYNGMDVIMGLIFIAQLFCWYGVLYQNNLMHVIEEGIWMITMPIIGFSYLYFSNLIINNITKYKFLIVFIISIGYTMFMIFIDVPMYYNRYLEYNNFNYNSFYENIKDTLYCKLVSYSYSIWKNEISWMTGYFIGATYLSIELNNFRKLVIE